MRSQERKGLSGSLQVKRSKVFGGERKMLNPLKCITIDRISIASFLRQLRDTEETQSFFKSEQFL